MGMLINNGEKGKVLFFKYNLKNMLTLERRLGIKFGDGFTFGGRYSGTYEIGQRYCYKGVRHYYQLFLFVDPVK